MNNSIFVIKPYRWEGQWVFDDEARGLAREPLVAGMPEIIERACAARGIADPDGGFIALFSPQYFPGADLVLEHVRADESGSGDWYRVAGSAPAGEAKAGPMIGMEGWLCPALLLYLDPPPEKIYIQI